MRRRVLLLGVVGVLLTAAVARAATPPPAVNPPAPDGSVFDPRLIPSVPDAEAALAEAVAWVADVRARIEQADADVARLRAQVDGLHGEDRALTERVEQARRRLRVLAVERYVAGGPISTLEFFTDAPSAADLTWRRFMLDASFDSTRDAAREYDRSIAGVDEDLVELARATDRAQAEGEAARAELPVAEAAVAEAELGLLAARHEDDHRSGRIVVVSGGDGGPTPEVSGNARGPAWERLRQCEAGGNYAIADRTGWFRGAYQFAVSTWYGLGGHGDPADAPPAEQDYRAQVLYDALGARPWPVCGRFLLEDPPERSDPIPGLVERLAPDEPLTGPGITTPSTSTSTTTSTASTSTTTATSTTAAPDGGSP